MSIASSSRLAAQLVDQVVVGDDLSARETSDELNAVVAFSMDTADETGDLHQPVLDLFELLLEHLAHGGPLSVTYPERPTSATQVNSRCRPGQRPDNSCIARRVGEIRP